MTSNAGYTAPPAYEDSVNDPKFASAPPSGMVDSETAYLPAAEGGFVNSAGFEDNNVRRLFIRKVYSILTIQLIFTGGVIAAFQTSDVLKSYVGPSRK